MLFATFGRFSNTVRRFYLTFRSTRNFRHLTTHRFDNSYSFNLTNSGDAFIQRLCQTFHFPILINAICSKPLTLCLKITKNCLKLKKIQQFKDMYENHEKPGNRKITKIQKTRFFPKIVK